jgi:hypothetical protein
MNPTSLVATILEGDDVVDRSRVVRTQTDGSGAAVLIAALRARQGQSTARSRDGAFQPGIS